MKKGFSSSLNEKFFDFFTKQVFGTAFSDALKRGICMRCRREMYAIQNYEAIVSSKDIAEYQKSGLCPDCIKELEERR
ncbi:MAG: hypothetical protein JRI45_06625 [Deltaproteobacteria bacterium]|nr:hypothetical protein [Deltaproteobacteria bacterium]